MNKKNVKFILGFAIAIMVFGLFTYRTQLVGAIGAVLRSGADVPDGSLKMRTSESTTTPEFLQNGKGTTTLVFASENFSSLTMYVQTFASSTNVRSPLQIRLQGSDNNIDFFDYDPTIIDPVFFRNTNATTSIALASTSIPYSFQPYNRQGTTTKVVNMNLLPARYTKVIFTIASTTENTATTPYFDGMNLWVNMIGQNSGVK